jgi:hypothetical protein
MPVGLTHPTKDDILTLKASNGVFNLSLEGGVPIFGPLRPERRERHTDQEEERTDRDHNRRDGSHGCLA